MSRRWVSVALALSALPLLGATTRATNDAPDPRKIIVEALAGAGDVPAQAEALAALAWPSTGGDLAVRAAARQELVGFGRYGMAALWKAVLRVPPAEKVEVVEVLLGAFRRLTQGIPEEYLPALDDAIWFGTREARQVAIPELARFRSQPSVLTIIDAAREEAELVGIAVEALGAIGDPRARFYLERVLNEGKAGVRESAAVALGRLDESGRVVLRTATRSQIKEVRLAAVRALLPVATVDDLTALYEFAGTHADDDPATARSVQAATTLLEKALEAQQAADAATPALR